MLRTLQRVLVATVLALAVVGGQQASAELRMPPERACGPLARSTIRGIFATVVTCREARRIARTHYTSVKRNGSCKTRRIGCDIGRFRCLYAFKPFNDKKVLCSWRGNEKVILVYRR